MLENISTNLISDFIFLILLIGVGLLITFFTKRKKLLAFFNISSSNRIVIYLSHFKIRDGGAIGVDGTPRSFAGNAVAHSEMVVANLFRDNFNYFIPSLSDKPGILSKILVSDVKVSILPSPYDQGEIEQFNSFITFGSPAYNIASSYVEDKLNANSKFNSDNGKIKIGDAPEISDGINGFVTRILDRKNKRSVFYCAGISELGTIGAAHFLATQWKALFKKYGKDKNFTILLRFEKSNYNNWSIVFESEN